VSGDYDYRVVLDVNPHGRRERYRVSVEVPHPCSLPGATRTVGVWYGNDKARLIAQACDKAIRLSRRTPPTDPPPDRIFVATNSGAFDGSTWTLNAGDWREFKRLLEGGGRPLVDIIGLPSAEDGGYTRIVGVLDEWAEEDDKYTPGVTFGLWKPGRAARHQKAVVR
jgi:hypothetical protein